MPDRAAARATPPVPAGPLTSITGDLALGDREVRVYFGQAGENFDGITGEGFNAYERGRFRAAFDQIEAVCDIDFVEVNDPGAADFRLVLDTNQMDANTLGYFYSPGFGSLSGIGVFNGRHFDRSPGGNLDIGGDGAATIIHELLHGLGLMHPHDRGDGSTIMAGITAEFGDYGVGKLNQGIFTAMSYNPGFQTGAPPVTRTFGSESGPMALDIAALQLIYGAADHNTGNSTYRLPEVNGAGTGWQAIWDTGGTDTMIYGGSRNVTLDLREASLLQAAGGGGYVSSVAGIRGGFTIAQGAVIENALGGQGNDRLVGGGSGNVLNGRNGNDVAYGMTGNDTLRGGDMHDRLLGGAGQDRLFGGRGNDVLRGERGNDVLSGELGADVLTGGGGRDVFVFKTAKDSTTQQSGRDVITDFIRGEDKIDLSALDGNLGSPGNQPFNFISWPQFDGADRQGDVRFQQLSGGGVMVAVDLDGDGRGDMQILVQNLPYLTQSDFIL